MREIVKSGKHDGIGNIGSVQPCHERLLELMEKNITFQRNACLLPEQMC